LDSLSTWFYTLSLHDALPISGEQLVVKVVQRLDHQAHRRVGLAQRLHLRRTKAQHAARFACLQRTFLDAQAGFAALQLQLAVDEDRKSTCLNSSHVKLSYAVF